MAQAGGFRLLFRVWLDQLTALQRCKGTLKLNPGAAQFARDPNLDPLKGASRSP
jgi:hypothetical protein